MSCNYRKCSNSCQSNIKSFGVCDVSRISIDGSDRTALNWSEISIPEIMPIPCQKPDIEHLDQVYVEAKIHDVKLIETPFAYKSYERLATPFEVSSAITAINLAIIDLTPVVDAANKLLSVTGLPAIPEVSAVQAALAAVKAASVKLTTTIKDALKQLGVECISASDVVALVKSVIAALVVLKNALNTLSTAADDLVVATKDIPVVGGDVAAAAVALKASIVAAIGLIDKALTALKGIITLVGFTSVFEVIPNEEGACLSGRKLIVEGELFQKVVYTGLVTTQTVHSVCNSIPFHAYIIPYANFEGLTFVENIQVIADPSAPCVTTTVDGFLYNPDSPIRIDLCEDFGVDACVEDIFAYIADVRHVFKNVTVFLAAKPLPSC